MIKKSTNSFNPTESELEILQILWQSGPSTVKQVNSLQNENKTVGYTTTLKFMQIMTNKGLLHVDKENRQHIYSPAIEEKKAKLKLLNGFISKTFAGSASKMVMQALGNHKPSEKELGEIKKLIDKLEKEK